TAITAHRSGGTPCHAAPRRARRPADKVLTKHWPTAEQQRLPFAFVVERPPAITGGDYGVTRAGVLREPGPPRFPVLLVAFGSLAVQVSRPGRRGHRVKAGITTAPAAAAALGEPVLGQCPERRRDGRGREPGRPGHLGTAGLVAVEHLVDEPGCAAEDQERRVYPVDTASSPTTPPNAVRVGVRDPEGDPVRPGHPAAAHHVEQRVRLIAEKPQEPGHGPLGQAGLEGQVPRPELEHGGPGAHRRLADG